MPSAPAPHSYVVRELSLEEIPRIEPLICALNTPHMDSAGFHKHLQAMLAQGYRCAGVWNTDELIGVAGFWIFTRFWCGKQMDVDNVIIAEAYRHLGLGKKLMAWLEEKALSEGVETMVLDSYSAADKAHRFYFSQGYFIKGYHFIKPLVSRGLTGEARAPIRIK